MTDAFTDDENYELLDDETIEYIGSELWLGKNIFRIFISFIIVCSVFSFMVFLYSEIEDHLAGWLLYGSGFALVSWFIGCLMYIYYSEGGKHLRRVKKTSTGCQTIG